ncbi:unnamed protein product [Didymodactylos carnosus]|uniref:Uncharacterized protein n=1 Tax=Didymodactylos carnosus TaxID=1234261 RepID=A0A814BS33_9BILA|nr:unnamed protein product [Didymodactylos carnosus]CAF1155088.1 unnamed protein product [Didymodactylos carnosus]CAF3708624.1 unnamed protein product [Didymodactylos carnosus]CAF3965758.1 unnamed protein product [Didymodactylos carnosus]
MKVIDVDAIKDQITRQAIEGTQCSLTLVPINIPYGHDAEITCVAISIELDIMVSGSLDGTCNTYTVKSGTSQKDGMNEETSKLEQYYNFMECAEICERD